METSGYEAGQWYGTPATEKHVSAQPRDGQAGEDAQPRIQLLRHDVSRRIEGDSAKSKDSRGMGRGDDEAEQKSVARGAP
jgi:hypothetical protein